MVMFGIVSLTMRSVPGQATVAQDKEVDDSSQPGETWFKRWLFCRNADTLSG